MKIAYRAKDITEAEIIKGMLLASNIEAHVSGYYLQGGIGEIAPTDLAKVHVADENYEAARELLLEYEGIQPESRTASHRVEKSEKTFTQKFLVTLFLVTAISILSFWIGI